jgi:DNA-binding beta-propeller fold protein YncE
MLMIGGLISLLTQAGVALGQSDIVFMTADTPNLQSNLVRFDSGTETFAVNQGGSPGFLGVTVLNGELLVADYLFANAIQRFSPDGTYLGAFVTTNFSPTFLESDTSGNVYSTPIGEFDLPIARRFDSAGAVTQTFTHADMIHLTGIDADAGGNVYVADTERNELYKFAPGGSFLNRISLGSINPQDVAIDEIGNRLYLADGTAGTSALQIFDIAGAQPSLIGSITTPADTGIAGVHFASESGHILAADFGYYSGDPRGLEYSPSGQLLREYRPANTYRALDITTFPAPEPLDYNRDGVWDAADYVVWRKGDPAADGTGDGIVDQDDFQFWRERFGQSSLVGAGAVAAPEPNSAIPEPSALMLLGLAALAAILTRRQFAPPAHTLRAAVHGCFVVPQTQEKATMARLLSASE